MGLGEFQAGVVKSLNEQDARNQDLLSQVVTAATALSDNKSDVVLTGKEKEVKDVNEHGGIRYGGKDASLQGTGGVALLEYAKDAIQTAVSNISGVGTSQIQARKLVERKIGQLG